MNEYAFHPIADLFPMMETAAFAELVDDISEHGLREMIVLYEGKILDGRNRYRACREAGIEPEFCEFDGDDPLAYAISLNLKRRHLNESQRAMVAAELATFGKGRPTENPPIGGFKTEEAAKLLNVAPRSIERARVVREKGVPELVGAVKAGKMAVSAAAKIAKERADIQAELMKIPTPKQAKKLAIATGKHVADRKGMLQSPSTEEETAAAQARRKIWYKLRHVFDELTSIPAPEDVIPTIPSFQEEDVDEWLPQAINWLLRFQELWNEQREEA